MDDLSLPGTMKTLLIVYHSMTGGTRQMAEAAARGAASESTVRVRLLPAPVAQASDLLEADGYIFGTPENLAAMAGLMKDFFDRTYYPALDRISGRPYAMLICAGSDGHNAARQLARIATGWRLKAIADPLIVCTHAQTPEAILVPKIIGPNDLKRCEELWAALAAEWLSRCSKDPQSGGETQDGGAVEEAGRTARIAQSLDAATFDRAFVQSGSEQPLRQYRLHVASAI